MAALFSLLALIAFCLVPSSRDSAVDVNWKWQLLPDANWYTIKRRHILVFIEVLFLSHNSQGILIKVSVKPSPVTFVKCSNCRMYFSFFHNANGKSFRWDPITFLIVQYRGKAKFITTAILFIIIELQAAIHSFHSLGDNAGHISIHSISRSIKALIRECSKEQESHSFYTPCLWSLSGNTGDDKDNSLNNSSLAFTSCSVMRI